MAFSSTAYAQPITRARVKQCNIQPYLKSYVKHFWVFNRKKITNNNLIIAESTYRGDIYFYNSLDITDEQLEGIVRHEIGHLIWWRMGFDPYRNSEEQAEAFRILSKDCDSLGELTWIMRFLGYWK